MPMNDGFIRNREGTIISRVDGDWLRDGTGKLLARYDKSDDRTRDRSGRIVGKPQSLAKSSEAWLGGGGGGERSRPSGATGGAKPAQVGAPRDRNWDIMRSDLLGTVQTGPKGATIPVRFRD